MADKHIAIVGAGPGGLTAGMLLAKQGYKVSMYEKRPIVGGRNEAIKLGPYTFDTGPTFLMMTNILREVFEEAGRSLDKYCDVKPLDPMYKLSFPDFDISPTPNHEAMAEQIKKLFPGNEHGYERFLARESIRYKKMYPCLQKPYSTPFSMVSQAILKALPHLALDKTLYQVLGTYFKADKLRISFTFQAKYLGMSPWNCPGAFTIIPYVEHAFGVDHVTGGLSRISDAMAEVVREHGGVIHCSTPVKQVVTENGKATGLLLENGEKIAADAVVLNADFGHAATHLFAPGVIKKYSAENLKKKTFSCSTYMLYLGVDKLYDEPHHRIVFSGDYKKNINDIASHAKPSDDMSVYVRNASITDSTLAPSGHSALYVLVPVSNNRSGVEWTESLAREYRDKVINRIVERTSMKDLRSHIVEEKIITPTDWEQSHDCYAGATFNLGHTLTQMLYLRPHNRYEEVKNCYLVGGGTHPGSGLPTIYESGRISTKMIMKDI